MIGRDEFAAWFRLLETPGVGRRAARALLARFGSADAVLASSARGREEVVAPAVAQALAAWTDELQARLDAGWRWLESGSHEPRDVVVVGDPRYPAMLLESGDPPLLLYTRGRVELLQQRSIAVVGSRNPTPQGLENARAFAGHLGRAGFAVVSGLALGVDGAAHRGALDADAATIAVVGTGLDQIYPQRHRSLTQEIAGRGLIVSEFSIGTPALPPNFPVRNRIIAALGRGTLVVEAAVQSGSLITARFAAECGRDVFAIPGSIHAPQSRGCHLLIKQGAKLVDSAADIIDELPIDAGSEAKPATRSPKDEEARESVTDSLEDEEPRESAAVSSDDLEALPESDAASGDPVLRALGYEPMSLDELIARTGLGAAPLSARLLELEFAGRVARLPGQAFQRIERA